MADSSLSRENCIELLQYKMRQLQSMGATRYPCRSDFSEREVVAIKAFLGPWPRALEAAGIKPPRGDDQKQKNLEKRIRAKRERNKMRKNEKTDFDPQ